MNSASSTNSIGAADPKTSAVPDSGLPSAAPSSRRIAAPFEAFNSHRRRSGLPHPSAAGRRPHEAVSSPDRGRCRRSAAFCARRWPPKAIACTKLDGRGRHRAGRSRQPDLILLDLGLPDLDGLEVIQRVREWSKIPIVVLSARGQEKDKIAALDLGADDYVAKPFAVGELLARIRAALRRSTAASMEPARSFASARWRSISTSAWSAWTRRRST